MLSACLAGDGSTSLILWDCTEGWRSALSQLAVGHGSVVGGGDQSRVPWVRGLPLWLPALLGWLSRPWAGYQVGGDE